MSDSTSDEYEDYDEQAETPWIEWFCSLKGNEFLVEVDEDFVRDDFNLTGLHKLVSHYSRALDMILDADDDDDYVSEDQMSVYESDAEVLYGLIHARFILTNRGQSLMAELYMNEQYGSCPNVLCNKMPVLPVGLHTFPHQSKACVYCHQCNEIYHPKSRNLANIDGSFFGTTFPHLFLMQQSGIQSQAPIPRNPDVAFVPTIFGFKVARNFKDDLRKIMGVTEGDFEQSEQEQSAKKIGNDFSST
eukprot:GHVP01062724.1.p1 GENE.GHVP01062724.1~~GHVP01062724.1.p1  ORF type:complete len:259 (+),score=29.60 GHVP01062724.1:42-779(+)